MKHETTIEVSREELVEILEEKYNCKFSMNRLSPKGFKGWKNESN